MKKYIIEGLMELKRVELKEVRHFLNDHIKHITTETELTKVIKSLESTHKILEDINHLIVLEEKKNNT